MNFSRALHELKAGRRLERKGWNGKGMWLILIPENGYDFKDTFFNGNAKIEGLNPWIGMKTADNKFVPWLASQSDILAEDWEIAS